MWKKISFEDKYSLRLVFWVSWLVSLIILLNYICSPSDSSNIFFLGFSVSRWIIILVCLFILFINSIFCIYPQSFLQVADALLKKRHFERANEFILALMLFVFWVNLWISSTIFGSYAQIFEKARPLMLNIEFSSIFLLLAIMSIKFKKNTNSLIQYLSKKRIVIAYILIVASIPVIIMG